MKILVSLFRFIRKELRKGKCFYCRERRELRKVRDREGNNIKICFECYIESVASRSERRRFFKQVDKRKETEK